MAKTIKDFEFQGGHRRYPWDEWTNGQIWRVWKGEDFMSGINSFVTGLRKKARELGLKVRTSLNEDAGFVTFQFYASGDE